MNKEKKFTILLIVVGVIIFGLLGYKIYIDFFQKNESKETKRLELYGYTLSDNDTEVFKEKYSSLEKILNNKEVDFEEYAKVLSELFAIDFYTLSNKVASTDIGGLEYIYPGIIDNFKLKASDTVYKYVKVNFDGKRSQTLPEVKEAEVTKIEEGSYKYNDNSYDTFETAVSIGYTEDLNYPETINITLIKDNTKLYIVEVN